MLHLCPCPACDAKARSAKAAAQDNSLSPPSGFAFTRDSHLILADDFNHRIQIYDADGNCVAQFGEKGKGPGQFHYPKGCAVDAEGNIYVADSWNHRVQKFDADGRHLQSLGGCGDAKGQLNEPFDVAVDAQGRLLVVERYNHRIQIFDAAGVSLGWIGNRGSVLEEELAAIYETPSHLFSGPGFEFPTSIAAAQDGGWLIADSGNHRVVRFDARWRRRFSFGERGAGPGCFQYPQSVAVAPNGVVCATDLNNNRVQAFTSTGAFLFECSQREKPQDLQAPNLAAFTPDGSLLLSLTFDTAVFEFEMPHAAERDLLEAAIRARPEDTGLLQHKAQLEEQSGDPAAALATHREAAIRLTRENPSAGVNGPLAGHLSFSRLAREHNDPQNTDALLAALKTVQSVQQAARRNLLETHLEWEQAALDHNRRLFAEQKRVLASGEDPRTFDKELYAAEERDKTLFRKLRRLFFVHRDATRNFTEFAQNLCALDAPECRERGLAALESNWQTLCASLLHLLETKETQEETMVRSFSEMNDPGGKWEPFLILAASNLRILDVIRQLHFEMRACMAAFQAAARTHPKHAAVQSTLSRCFIDHPAAEHLHKILLGFQEDWNFHRPLEIEIKNCVQAWIAGFQVAEPPAVRELTIEDLVPVPFDSEALDLAETARAGLIEAMPLAVQKESILCAGETVSLKDAARVQAELLSQVTAILREQHTYDEKHGGILDQLKTLRLEKNRTDALSRGFNPQDKKAPITQQHNQDVVQFQIGLLRRMALTLEINEARTLNRLIQGGALLLTLADAAANASWIDALNALASELAAKTAAARARRKALSFAISGLNGEMDNQNADQIAPDIDRAIELRDRLAAEQVELEIGEARLNRLLKNRQRVHKLQDAIAMHAGVPASGAPGSLQSAPLFAFGNTGSRSGHPLQAYGIAAHPSGGWIAADYESHRMCVFHPDATLAFHFGGWGNAPGKFKYPIAVAADSAGCLHIADEKNTRIQKFTAGGAHLLSYGDAGESGQPLGPVFDLDIDAADRIWVPDPAHDRVCVYDTEGRPVREFTARGLHRPAGVCCLEDGRIVIGDGSEHALKLFDPQGKEIAGLKKETADCGDIYALACHAGHGLFAADYWGGCILHLDTHLRVLAVHDNGGWGKVSGIAVIGDRLLVSDPERFRIEVFRLPDMAQAVRE